MHFRQAQNGFRIVSTNAAVAGQRQLQSTTQTSTVDRGNHRDRQRVDLGHYLLPLTRKIFRFLRTLRPGDHVNVGPGNKVIRLGRDKHQTANGLVFADLPEHRANLSAKLRLQGIHFFVRHINGDYGDIIEANRQVKCRCHFHYSASRTIAAPRPPAAQAVTRPNPPPRRRSSCNV